MLVSGLTLGLAFPAMMCWHMRWEAKHTFINGRRLKFDGTGGQLFGKYLLWMLLSIITFGIYFVYFMPIAMEKWKAKHTHYEDWQEGTDESQESYFDGSAAQLFGVNLLTRFVTVITLSFGMYWAHCYKERWRCKHTVIGGDRLAFDGRAAQYFGKRVLWTFLTVITFGIYSFWLKVKSKKWTVSHTKLAEEIENCGVLAEDNRKTNSLSVAGFILSFLMPFIGLIFVNMFAFLFPIGGIVMCAVGLAQCKKKNEKGRGLAIAGIVISSIFTLISIASAIFAVIMLIVSMVG